MHCYPSILNIFTAKFVLHLHHSFFILGFYSGERTDTKHISRYKLYCDALLNQNNNMCWLNEWIKCSQINLKFLMKTNNSRSLCDNWIKIWSHRSHFKLNLEVFIKSHYRIVKSQSGHTEKPFAGHSWSLSVLTSFCFIEWPGGNDLEWSAKGFSAWPLSFDEFFNSVFLTVSKQTPLLILILKKDNFVEVYY